MSNDLMGTNDIAALLGVSRSWVVDSITKRPDFPAPVVNISQRIRKWSRADVIKWMTKKR